MSTPDDGGDSPKRALLLALSAMAGVALLVGLAVGGAVITVLHVTGVDAAESSASAKAHETLYMPRYHPTKTPQGDDLGLPQPSPSESGTKSSSPSPKTDRIKLFVAPQSVRPGERINFNGVYVDGEGVALQIQRNEGGAWTDFPVTATVRGGVFSTWIQTSHTGKQQFRVLDKTTNRTSNVVTVTVG